MKIEMKKTLSMLVAASWVCGVAQGASTDPGKSAVTRAVQQYLGEHGDLCIGKFKWPRLVTAEDRQGHSNDAVQLPVLERLGLVQSVEIPAAPAPAAAAAGSQPQAAPAEPTRSYSLTAKGRQYYLEKKHTTLGVHGQAVENTADFCVAHLTLDKVTKWTPPDQVRGQTQTLVKYTYKIKAADWMTDSEARKVFPVVDRIIRGAGILEMTATLHQQDGKWVPVLPG
jgi:hypothetical protein